MCDHKRRAPAIRFGAPDVCFRCGQGVWKCRDCPGIRFCAPARRVRFADPLVTAAHAAPCFPSLALPRLGRYYAMAERDYWARGSRDAVVDWFVVGPHPGTTRRQGFFVVMKK